MRVTSSMPFNQLARGIKEQMNALTKLNLQLIDGKKITKPSDDVSGTVEALGYRLSLSSNEQYQQNLTRVKTILTFTETQLNQVSDTLNRIKEMALVGGDASITDSERDYYAENTTLLKGFLLDLSNSTYENRYLFSGFRTDQKAYAYDSATQRYLYQGDSGQIPFAVDRDMTQVMNFVGSSDDPSVTTVFSFTLADAEEVTLSDGSLVTYTAVPHPGSGTTSIQVTISHPDHPGDPDYEDQFSFSNFMEMADILAHAWRYEEVDGTPLNPSEAFRRVQAMVFPLEKAVEQVITVRSELAARQIFLENRDEGLKAEKEVLQNRLSAVQDTDLAETIVSLQQVSMSLEALRRSSARILSQSLFDFLS
jgi:flagellar hook-associated protein 3 FlgL